MKQIVNKDTINRFDTHLHKLFGLEGNTKYPTSHFILSPYLRCAYEGMCYSENGSIPSFEDMVETAYLGFLARVDSFFLIPVEQAILKNISPSELNVDFNFNIFDPIFLVPDDIYDYIANTYEGEDEWENMNKYLYGKLGKNSIPYDPNSGLFPGPEPLYEWDEDKLRVTIDDCSDGTIYLNEILNGAPSDPVQLVFAGGCGGYKEILVNGPFNAKSVKYFYISGFDYTNPLSTYGGITSGSKLTVVEIGYDHDITTLGGLKVANIIYNHIDETSGGPSYPFDIHWTPVLAELEAVWVPDDVVEFMQENEGWSDISELIKPLSELPEELNVFADLRQ